MPQLTDTFVTAQLAARELPATSQDPPLNPELAHRRAAGDVATAREHLVTAFREAPFCVAAKLLEAAVLLEEQDYSGAAAVTGTVRTKLKKRT